MSELIYPEERRRHLLTTLGYCLGEGFFDYLDVPCYPQAGCVHSRFATNSRFSASIRRKYINRLLKPGDGRIYIIPVLRAVREACNRPTLGRSHLIPTLRGAEINDIFSGMVTYPVDNQQVYIEAAMKSIAIQKDDVIDTREIILLTMVTQIEFDAVDEIKRLRSHMDIVIEKFIHHRNPLNFHPHPDVDLNNGQYAGIWNDELPFEWMELARKDILRSIFYTDGSGRLSAIPNVFVHSTGAEHSGVGAVSTILFGATAGRIWEDLSSPE